MNYSTNSTGFNEIRVYAPSDPLFSPETVVWSGALNHHQTLILAEFVLDNNLDMTFCTCGGNREDVDLKQVRHIIITNAVGLFIQNKVPFTKEGAIRLIQQLTF